MEYLERLKEIFNEEKSLLNLKNKSINLALDRWEIKINFNSGTINLRNNEYARTEILEKNIEDRMIRYRIMKSAEALYNLSSNVSKREDDKGYIIKISDDDQRDEKLFRKSIKHELYHVFKGDCDKTKFTVLGEFWQETRARLYEHYSIRL